MADVPIMTLRNCVFTGNQSTTRGGVIDLTPGNGAVLTIEDSTLLGNSAGDRGGVVSMLGFGSTLTIRRSTLSGNTSGSFGGVAYIRDQFKLTVEDSTLSGNKAKTAGGAIYTFGNASKFLISNSTLSGNAATGGMFPGSGARWHWWRFPGPPRFRTVPSPATRPRKATAAGRAAAGCLHS